jgi:carbonic anhydrase/acetyltransferase-like protein (isoleucine patch superfamily)
VPQIGEGCWVADSATVAGDVTLGKDVSIWFGAVLRGDIEGMSIGDESNIQDLCVLHTDEHFPLTVGRRVTVGHKVMLHGCTIEDHALIGINAVVLNGAVIGEGSIIGANSLITEGKRIPPRSLVMGQPGRVVREISDSEYEMLTHAAEHYVSAKQAYATQLEPLDG